LEVGELGSVNWEVGMLRALILGTLFASLLMNSSWAQNKGEQVAGPPYPGASEITFQWVYSCASETNCSFICPGGGGASHVTKLTIYLGTIPVGSTQNAPALLYDFSTKEIQHGNGFSISTGLSMLSCQVNGLTPDYSGPPRDGQTTIETTAGIKQNKK
jgi:hypothetical protein